MKRALLPLLLTLPLGYMSGCSSEDAPVTVPGAAGTGSPGASGSGGSAGGTDPGTAGTPPGTSGSGNTEAGTSSAAGMGTGGSGGGAGGSAPVGGMGGSGTAGGGAGGQSTGGSGGGTGGTGGGAGGTGGGAGGTGGAPAMPVSVGKLDGMLIMTPCEGTPTNDDCVSSGWIYEGKSTACVNGRLDSDLDKSILDFPITGGERGKRYMATMHFYGIMEPKNYGNRVTRSGGATRPNSSLNPSTPEGWATADAGVTVDTTTYNNYEIHTFDETGKELKQYFINSDLGEGHYTFAINYEREIEIVAGGKVHVRIFDSNCRMIKNCLGGPQCNDQKARRIDVSAAMPQPTALMQPGMGRPADQSGQWWLIDVKGIVAKP